MPTPKCAARTARRVQLDIALLPAALRRGLLAASPNYKNALDPLVPGVPENDPATPFMFSDIPDARFREPRAVISMSSIAGGTKS